MERGKVFAFQLLTDIDIGNVYLDFKKIGFIWQASCAQICDFSKT